MSKAPAHVEVNMNMYGKSCLLWNCKPSVCLQDLCSHLLLIKPSYSTWSNTLQGRQLFRHFVVGAQMYDVHYKMQHFGSGYTHILMNQECWVEFVVFTATIVTVPVLYRSAFIHRAGVLMYLVLAAMLPETPNTEKFANAVASNTCGVHAVNGTEGSCTLHQRNGTQNRKTGGLHECSQYNLLSIIKNFWVLIKYYVSFTESFNYCMFIKKSMNSTEKTKQNEKCLQCFASGAQLLPFHAELGQLDRVSTNHENGEFSGNLVSLQKPGTIFT